MLPSLQPGLGSWSASEQTFSTKTLGHFAFSISFVTGFPTPWSTRPSWALTFFWMPMLLERQKSMSCCPYHPACYCLPILWFILPAYLSRLPLCCHPHKLWSYLWSETLQPYGPCGLCCCVAFPANIKGLKSLWEASPVGPRLVGGICRRFHPLLLPHPVVCSRHLLRGLCHWWSFWFSPKGTLRITQTAFLQSAQRFILFCPFCLSGGPVPGPCRTPITRAFPPTLWNSNGIVTMWLRWSSVSSGLFPSLQGLVHRHLRWRAICPLSLGGVWEPLPRLSSMRAFILSPLASLVSRLQRALLIKLSFKPALQLTSPLTASLPLLGKQIPLLPEAFELSSESILWSRGPKICLWHQPRRQVQLG